MCSFRNKTSLFLLSFFCLTGSTLGLTAHFLVAYNWQWVEADLSGKNGKDVVLTTLYLQVPQHVLEITSSILLSYGMAKGKRQFFLPWLIINAIGISLYSTVLLVMGMVVSNYTFFGFLFIGIYAFLWYHVQCYYTALAQNGESDITYSIMV